MYKDSIQLSPVALRDAVCTSAPSFHQSCTRLKVIAVEGHEDHSPVCIITLQVQ